MKKKLYQFSAYQAGSWRMRATNHLDDLMKTNHWNKRGSRLECSPLQEVLLYKINLKKQRKVKNPEEVQHLKAVNWKKLSQQLKKIKKTFEKNNILVHEMQSDLFAESPPANLMFVRDLFFSTPWGFIIGRMASEVRAGEEKWAQLALAKLGFPILSTVTGEGHFEGADVLWLNPTNLLIGLGNRTNLVAFKQIQAVLSPYGVKCHRVNLPRQTQHLLGILQIVAENKALVRITIAPAALIVKLKKFAYTVISVFETDEVTRRQAMNLVTVAPQKVIIPKNVPRFKNLLKRNGIQVVAEVDIGELRNAAGGLARAVCAGPGGCRLPGCPV